MRVNPRLMVRTSQTNSLRYKFFAEILGAAFYGTWRSLVARTLGVGEAPSSNLGVPTSFYWPRICADKRGSDQKQEPE